MENTLKTVTVRPENKKEYDVYIARDCIMSIPEFLSKRGYNGKICAVSDKTVAGLYLEKVRMVIENEGYECVSFVFDGGEMSKSPETVLELISYLSENGFSGGDMLLALGGGVVGDVTGFASSVYLRGIPFIQVPTTLLSAVDSSVGGKNGVNYHGEKNRIGTFWQPEAVFCDTAFFDTLGKDIFASGMAEVIKYAALFGGKLKKQLDDEEEIDEIVKTCVEIKSEIVARDELDKGERHLLNFGHTFGHAVESISENEVDHGHAVAIGMKMAFRAANRMGICPESETGIYLSLARKYGLETEFECEKQAMLNVMLDDKKRSGNDISLILPRRFGECFIYKTDVSSLDEILTKAMS